MELANFSNQKLCEMIVASRYLGFGYESFTAKEVIIHCMKQLSERRSNGDDFAFEKTIEDLEKEMPELDAKMPNLKELLSGAIK